MTAQTTRSLMCLNSWFTSGLLKEKDVVAAIRGEPEVKGAEDVELENGWDAMNLD